MAAGALSPPGSEAGPCLLEAGQEVCPHFDCKLTRADAAAPCQICSKPIGYETRFYLAPEAIGRQLVHAVCLEKQVEKEKGGPK